MKGSRHAGPSGGARTAWRLSRAVLAVIGWVVIVAAVDAGVGAVLGGTGTDEPPPEALFAGPDDAPELVPSNERDPRVDAPAMGDVPWAEDYWAEAELVQSDYVPFLGGRPGHNEMTYFDSADGVRRSYQQAEATEDAPTVWFFGGSTMWGEGQRDEYTIASHVARLAEADGVPLRVQNRGGRGWVMWHELLALEAALAEEAHPDLVVFYDGINERSTQDPAITGAQPSDDPTVFAGDFTWETVPAPFTVRPDVAHRRTLAETWADSSLLLGLLGAEPAEAHTGHPPTGSLVERTADVYERGRRLAADLVDDAGLAAVFFWQPTTNLDDIADRLVARLSPDVIDISDVFDDVPRDEIYLDGAHTNERGAELVAAAMWAELRPMVDQLEDVP